MVTSTSSRSSSLARLDKLSFSGADMTEVMWWLYSARRNYIADSGVNLIDQIWDSSLDTGLVDHPGPDWDLVNFRTPTNST
jgi:hypothetical protein